MKPTTLKFYKDTDNKWYIDYPEWTGAKWELEMVCGADTMLEIISQGNDLVYITMSTESFDNAFTLTKIQDTPDIGGATYLLKNWYGIVYDLEMWLCHVTEFVFGELPETIYIK